MPLQKVFYGSMVSPVKSIIFFWCAEFHVKLPRKMYLDGSFLFQDLVLQFDIYRKLEKHRGCVNTVSFNAAGDVLVSGSDDRRIILWDWESGHVKLSFESGHINNVFQAKFMPYTDDRSIVTCAADGQVIPLFKSGMLFWGEHDVEHPYFIRSWYLIHDRHFF